ncbi:hypothetical protein [Brevibacterium luteolum]|uniref:Uncharacterized protein n=1 Tax=Brevibacterium luteolum TaxID=199591 RepID=A0A2N6PJJ3_9MICO|nr:hypothetical protein [Brevibacterium luteolum]PMB98844.1 hypothetical protein CJ198_05975 [Brevibacterium luteolum]
MWTLVRLVIGSALVSGIVFGAGHVTRLIDTQALPDTPAIAVQQATAELDENSDTLRAAIAEVGRTVAPEAAYLPTASGQETRPTASGQETRPTRKDDDDDDDTPSSGAATSRHTGDAALPADSAQARVNGLAADLSRAVANGHATPAAAERFLTEVAGYIRHDTAA